MLLHCSEFFGFPKHSSRLCPSRHLPSLLHTLHMLKLMSVRFQQPQEGRQSLVRRLLHMLFQPFNDKSKHLFPISFVENFMSGIIK